MNLGLRMKELREKRGFSQKKLAEWAGVSQTHLRRVELGLADIKVGHLSLICEALGVSLHDFFADESENKSLNSAINKLTDDQRRALTQFLHELQG